MKLSFITAAAALVLAASGMSAEAGCVNNPAFAKSGAPQKMPPLIVQHAPSSAPAAGDASKNIVGTWLVTYTVEGNAFGQALIQWHDDGTEWENINLPISGGNICVGSWKKVDGKHVSRNHIGWLYTDGTLSGYFTETETDKVSGDTYTGTNEQKVYDLDGNLLADVTGTSSATRISP